MAIEVTLKRTLGGFLPANRQSEEAMAEIKPGDIVRATIKRPRNLKHHSKWFALLQAVYPHQETWPTFDLFRKAIQRALGYVEEVNGQVFDVSIAFDKMDQSEFEQFYQRGEILILTRILPGIDKSELTTKVNEIMSGRDAA